ncbi:MAG: glycosyltransferase family 2 protein, partial [Bryobacteraceae bacterium]
GGACITRPASEPPVARAIAIALSHPFGIGNARFRLGTAEPRHVDTVPFGCFRRELFTRIGLFDEDLVRNQDDEFNFRILKAGGTVLLVPGVVSYYYARPSLRQLARMYYQYGYFKPLVARKTGGIFTLRQLVPPLFVSGLIIAAVLAPWVAAARALLVLILGTYVAANVACSAPTVFRSGVKVGGVLPAAFTVLHASYGLGFLRGVLRFLILRRPSHRPVPLSR